MRTPAMHVRVELYYGSGDEYEDGTFVGVMSTKSAGLPVLSCCLIGCADAACLRDVDPSTASSFHKFAV